MASRPLGHTCHAQQLEAGTRQNTAGTSLLTPAHQRAQRPGKGLPHTTPAPHAFHGPRSSPLRVPGLPGRCWCHGACAPVQSEAGNLLLFVVSAETDLRAPVTSPGRGQACGQEGRAVSGAKQVAADKSSTLVPCCFPPGPHTACSLEQGALASSPSCSFSLITASQLQDFMRSG